MQPSNMVTNTALCILVITTLTSLVLSYPPPYRTCSSGGRARARVLLLLLELVREGDGVLRVPPRLHALQQQEVLLERDQGWK